MKEYVAGRVAAAALLVLATVMPLAAAGASWAVDTEASRISFVGVQMGVPVEGEFETFGAQITFDPENPGAGTISIDVDMASVQMPVAQVVAELKKDKWFDVARFPVGHFETTSIEARGGDRYVAVGKLTLRDVTRDVTVPFSLTVQGSGTEQRATAKGELSVDRSAFGIGSGEWGDDSIVANEVRIRFEIAGSKQM